VQARIMGIADIFEALTARDRPYKPGMTLHILGKMCLDGHVDPDLFDIFVRRPFTRSMRSNSSTPRRSTRGCRQNPRLLRGLIALRLSILSTAVASMSPIK
jgi:HD-GYP domain-containing protein (c-di-GMP phosphodiesterase class II)